MYVQWGALIFVVTNHCCAQHKCAWKCFNITFSLIWKINCNEKLIFLYTLRYNFLLLLQQDRLYMILFLTIKPNRNLKLLKICFSCQVILDASLKFWNKCIYMYLSYLLVCYIFSIFYIYIYIIIILIRIFCAETN